MAIAIGAWWILKCLLSMWKMVYRAACEKISQIPKVPGRQSTITVVRDASEEIRSSIINATLIIIGIIYTAVFLSGMGKVDYCKTRWALRL